MRPDECRVCWEPICIHTACDGLEPWSGYGPAGDHCPYFTPEPEPFHRCWCCGSGNVTLDYLDADGPPQLVGVCEDGGRSTTLDYSEPEDAVKAWNDGEVCSE